MTPRRQVLLVDDEEAILFALSEFLTVKGYSVVCASCLEEGLRHLRDAPWDLLVTDLKLTPVAGLEGFSLVAAAVEAHPRIRVLVLSAFASEIDTERARALGVSTILTKPFDLAVLEGELARLASIDSA